MMYFVFFFGRSKMNYALLGSEMYDASTYALHHVNLSDLRCYRSLLIWLFKLLSAGLLNP